MMYLAPKQPPLILSRMNWCSIRFEMRKDRIKDNSAPVRLVVKVRGERWRKDLGVNVPIHLWDDKASTIKGNSSEAKELRFLIEGEYAKAYKVLIDMHLASAAKSISEFEIRFNDRLERKCFLKFMEEQSYDRYMHGEITLGTYKHCKVVVNKIKLFCGKGSLGFDEITTDWLNKFERFDTRDILDKSGADSVYAVQNTVANHLKKISAYIRIARVKGVTNVNPFEGFKIKKTETQREFLTEDDLKKLIEMYRKNFYAEGSSAEGVLKNFLLMCATGMRISDLQNFKRSMIKNELIVYTPIKTRAKNKQAKIPLNPLSREIIDSFEGEFLRFKMSDQKQNVMLKKIARDAKLNVGNLTNHLARHTFASLFLSKGGKVEMLQSLLAHGSIATTMKYVHLVDEERIRQVNQAFSF